MYQAIALAASFMSGIKNPLSLDIIACTSLDVTPSKCQGAILNPTIPTPSSRLGAVLFQLYYLSTICCRTHVSPVWEAKAGITQS